MSIEDRQFINSVSLSVKHIDNLHSIDFPLRIFFVFPDNHDVAVQHVQFLKRKFRRNFNSIIVPTCYRKAILRKILQVKLKESLAELDTYHNMACTSHKSTNFVWCLITLLLVHC